MADIGYVVTGADVRKAAVDVIRRFGPLYLRHLGEQAGLGDLAAPSIVHSVDLDVFPAEQLPVVVVTSAPVTETEWHTDEVSAQFLVAVGVIVSAPEQSVQDLCALYIAAIRTLLIQNHGWPTDPPHPLDIGRATWLEESYDVFPFEDSRSMAAGRALFSVWVSGVVSLPGAQIPDGSDQEWQVQSVENTISPE